MAAVPNGNCRNPTLLVLSSSRALESISRTQLNVHTSYAGKDHRVELMEDQEKVWFRLFQAGPKTAWKVSSHATTQLALSAFAERRSMLEHFLLERR